MRTKLITTTMMLLIAISATWAAETVTMKTTRESVNLLIEKTGEGEITSGGVPLGTGDWIIVPAVDGEVVLTATGTAQLTSLTCSNNLLTELTLSDCTALTSTDCSDNLLTALNISGCTGLTALMCGFNQLTALDVSGCTELRFLGCSYNQLTELNISNNTLLTSLGCENNLLTALNLSNNTLLTSLYSDNNLLTALDVSSNTALTTLYCGNNLLTTMNLTGCTALYYAYYGGQQIEIAGTGAFNNPVSYTNAAGISLPITIDETDYATGEPINTIPDSGLLPFTIAGSNFSGTFIFPDKLANGTIATMTTNKATVNLNLQWIGTGSVTYNGVSLKKGDNENIPVEGGSVTLTTTGVVIFEELGCYNNGLTTLDLSGCSTLKYLYCHSNSLTELNLSGCTNLQYMNAGGQEITISGATSAFTNPVLYTNATAAEPIQSGSASYAHGTAIPTPASGIAAFTTNSAAVYGGTPFGGIFIIPEKLTSGTIATMTTTNATVSISVKWMGAGTITANGTPLENNGYDDILAGEGGVVELATSGGAILTELYCGGNALTSLDVSGCAALMTLYCWGNALTTLDVSGCATLTNMDAETQVIQYSVPEGDILVNPVLYKNPTGAESIQIGEDFYAYGAEIPIPANGVLAFTAAPVGSSYYPFRGTIVIPEKQVTRIAAIMTTTEEIVSFGYESTTPSGYGTITANGIPLQPNPSWTEWLGIEAVAGEVVLEITGDLQLTYLNIETSLTDLDVSGCADLENLNCSNLGLTSLNIDGCTNLTNLNCYSNSLTSLDVNSNASLAYLNCESNLLTSLDVSGCTNLYSLSCGGNMLTSLDIRDCDVLGILYAGQSQITLSEVKVPYDTDQLVLPVPVMFNGAPITFGIMGDDVVYDAGNLVWNISGESGEVYFGFDYLPEGILFGSFYGNIVQPWVRGMPTHLTATAATEITIRSLPDCIVVSGVPVGERITVYNLAGIQITNIRANADETRVALPQGCYVVKAGNKATKVVL